MELKIFGLSCLHRPESPGSLHLAALPLSIPGAGIQATRVGVAAQGAWLYAIGGASGGGVSRYRGHEAHACAGDENGVSIPSLLASF